ncbi:ParB/RepB/Spo0J family partition protein [Pseudoflavonifractor sp. 524-17]|uniref:ParB/RepB/Spo0J family partition protein n=1 Tax=Pseudoflavonifractor sp. 524-17 TaxID=2304577 RepID=UPI001379E36A|nr:ParB/RepB/Spo0J family partition protein [Pseudoflavonifractor sp. 524-17]NCE66365.1 ParB/RepB/Spo0J family partition protein [Pseudoflavonifractor sp. 524-17]
MNIQEIKVSECMAFQNNPFQVRDDEGMELLVQSIKEFGVMTPVVVRPVKESGYEIVSGHRRIHACKRAGIEEIPALVHDMERDSAVIFMVDSNIQREGLLPSEKAFAYKMKVEALRHQGKRSVQPGQKSSRGAVAQNAGESETQVQRYIRLTKLEKPLLALVDEGRIAFTPAVELSYLTQREQRDLLETIESEDATPSLSQAIRMRKLSETGQLDMDGIFHIMSEVKGNQKEYIKLSSDKVGKYLNKLRTPQQKEDFILKALAFYARHLERQRSSRDGR